MVKTPQRGRAKNRRDETPPPAKPRAAGEIVFGFRAAMAVFQTRPAELSQIGYAHDRRRDVEALVRWAEGHRVPCDELPDDELARIAGSTHHEGLVVLAAPRKWSTMGDFAEAMIRTRGFAVALDRVRNPYNVGAILRSAAFFGLQGALLGAIAPHPALAPDAIRVAEGGAEHLRLARTTDLAETLVRLRARGLRVLGGESDGKENLFGYPFVGPTILVLGHEREGLSPAVRSACDALVTIPGSGKIESLNVGIAASLCIAELARPRSTS
jgi:TrmH RNA methyltransferase